MDLESALACVLITGLVMILLTVTGLVDKGMRLVPNFLKIATIAGIGMIITFIGLESAGLIIRGQIADLLTLSVPSRLHSPQPAFSVRHSSNPSPTNSATSRSTTIPPHITLRHLLACALRRSVRPSPHPQPHFSLLPRYLPLV